MKMKMESAMIVMRCFFPFKPIRLSRGWPRGWPGRGDVCSSAAAGLTSQMTPSVVVGMAPMTPILIIVWPSVMGW